MRGAPARGSDSEEWQREEAKGMTDMLVYSPDCPAAWKAGHPLRWHSSHRVLGSLVLGDRLWVVTSGKALAEVKVSGIDCSTFG